MPALRIVGSTFEMADREGFKALINSLEAVYPNDPPDQVRFYQLMRLVEAANDLPDGEYLELGTHVGITLKLIHQYMDKTGRLCSVDTFEGFDRRDIAVEPNKRWRVGNFLPTSAERVRDFLGNPDNLTVIAGWFPDAFEPLMSLKWRFAHVDMDLQQPTARALEILWPRMVPGGIIVLHDYRHPMFCVREVVDEFCHRIGLLPVEMPDRFGTGVIRKPLR